MLNVALAGAKPFECIVPISNFFAVLCVYMYMYVLGVYVCISYMSDYHKLGLDVDLYCTLFCFCSFCFFSRTAMIFLANKS